MKKGFLLSLVIHSAVVLAVLATKLGAEWFPALVAVAWFTAFIVGLIKSHKDYSDFSRKAVSTHRM